MSFLHLASTSHKVNGVTYHVTLITCSFTFCYFIISHRHCMIIFSSLHNFIFKRQFFYFTFCCITLTHRPAITAAVMIWLQWFDVWVKGLVGCYSKTATRLHKIFDFLLAMSKLLTMINDDNVQLLCVTSSSSCLMMVKQVASWAPIDYVTYVRKIGTHA